MTADPSLLLPPPSPPPPLPARLRPPLLSPGAILRFPFTPNGHTLHARVVAIDGHLAALDLLIATLPKPGAPAAEAAPIRTVASIAHILSIWQVVPTASTAGNLTAPPAQAAA
jgi:hypothetical protein